MSTPITAAQLERLRREAKQLGRHLTIPHSEALNRIAAQHGFTNWSLLSKHSLTGPAVADDDRKPYYLHGDQAEDAPTTYYCARCDLFVEAIHFQGDGWHKDVAGDCDRYLASLARWNKLPRQQKVGRRRKVDAPNALAQRALAAQAAYEASRAPFHRWLEGQKGREDATGDLASDAMSDKRFPVAATTRKELREYLNRRGASGEAVSALRDAWAEFTAQTSLV